MIKLRIKIKIFLPAALLFCFSFNNCIAQNFEKWETEITALEKSASVQPVKRGKYIVFIGSSSIVGWKSLATNFPNKKILRNGFGGSQTFEVTHFADRLVAPYNPKQVVIYAGENDIAEGQSPEKVLADFKVLFNTIRQLNKNIVITFISIKPSPSRKKFIPQFRKANQLIKDFLAASHKTSYVDIYSVMLQSNGQPKPGLFQLDSLHMVKAGYDLWAKTLQPFLR